MGIDDNKPHKVSEVICIRCYTRWLAVRPIFTKLKDIECYHCGSGYVIETGEEIENTDLQARTEKQRRYLYGHIFRVVGDFMGERDIRAVEALLLDMFHPEVESLKHLNKQQTSEFIDAIIVKFTNEYGLIFEYEEKERGRNQAK